MLVLIFVNVNVVIIAKVIFGFPAKLLVINAYRTVFIENIITVAVKRLFIVRRKRTVALEPVALIIILLISNRQPFVIFFGVFLEYFTALFYVFFNTLGGFFIKMLFKSLVLKNCTVIIGYKGTAQSVIGKAHLVKKAGGTFDIASLIHYGH